MTQTNRPEYCVPPLLNSPPLATLAVALLYAVVAQVGYLTTTLPGHISPIFPSAGVALAAVLILGRSALLGVLLGSFLANSISYILSLPSDLSSQVRIHGGPTIVFVIGFGAMASAGAGAFLVRKFCQDQYPLGSARNLLVLVAVGGLSCYTISATFGVLGLALAGITPWQLFGYSWLTWWIGDVAGVIIVAPLILAWLHAMTWWKGLRRAGEAAVLGGVLLSLSLYVFFRSAPLEYGLLPLLLVAAFRFDMRGATAAAAIVAVLATIGTSHGTGPFSRGSVNESLLLLHSFLSVNVICALFLAAVLSERKAAEDSLRESEGKFVAAFRNSPDAVYVTDGETARFLEVNESFESLSGWTRAETIGRTAQDLDFWVNPVDQERHFGTRSKEGRLRNLEVSCRFRDGSLHSLEVSSQPLEFGRRRCFLTIARDITERKQAEQEMERLQLELMQAQKMESIGRLAGGVAHDFNNLLTVINGYSRMLVDTLNTDDPRQQSAQEIYSAGQRAAGITKQLLAFSRKQVLELHVLDLNHLLKDMESMLRRLVGEDVEVRFALSAEGPTARADPHQLEQVVMNLAVNARDAMPDGGSLTIETVMVEVGDASKLSSTLKPGPHVCLRVSDTGSGMDKETQGRIFEPFFTTKLEGQGTGLGLSTVYGIVEQSGGSISVSSRPGAGTVFEILLPVVKPAESPGQRLLTETVLGGSETVLLVEDDGAVRRFLRQVLEGAGYRLLQAANGMEALTLAGSYVGRVDLLVTDLRMPGIGGLEVARRLRQERPGLAVIYMSGYANGAEVEEAQAERGTELIPKPFPPDVLLKRARRILDARRPTVN